MMNHKVQMIEDFMFRGTIDRPYLWRCVWCGMTWPFELCGRLELEAMECQGNRKGKDGVFYIDIGDAEREFVKEK